MKQFFSLLVVLMLFSVNAVAIETTPTGFYYPTGTSDPGPFAGWLSSGCNPGDPYFPGLYHIGHDYQTDLGAPVYLISDGIIADVSYGGWGETDGQTNVAIFVRHELSDGTFFLALYGHIQSSFTDEDVGVSVYAGNTLGVVGDWDYGIHLHFGVRPGTEIPLTNWGRMPCDSWPDTNGFVDPINWIENQIPAGSVPGSLVGYFIDGWNPDISPKFLDKYNDMATAGHPLGDPWDNGGSVFVHDLNDMWIQDFNGPDNGWDLPYTALIYYEDPWVNREAKLLKEGFWGFWMNQVGGVPGWEVVGVPISDEYPEGGKTRQRFRKFGPNHANDPSDWVRYYLEWDPDTDIITILDHDGQPTTLAEITVTTNGGVPRSVDDGVYHSGIPVSDFDIPFELVDGDSYDGFYAMVGEEQLWIDPFTVNGNMTIVIDNGAYPIASFWASPVIGEPGMSVWFFDESVGNIDWWYWDFGDGSTSTEQHPDHIYTASGNYTVSLLVSTPQHADYLVKEDYITVEDDAVAVEEGFVDAFALHNNYPNPFNPTTLITYKVKDTCHIRLGVYDLTGKLIVTLVDQVVQSGINQVVFDGSGLSSGVYFYKLETPQNVWSRKMTLVK